MKKYQPVYVCGVLYRSPFKSIPFHECGVHNFAFIFETKKKTRKAKIRLLLQAWFENCTALWLSTETENCAHICRLIAITLHNDTVSNRFENVKRNEKLDFSSKYPHGAHKMKNARAQATIKCDLVFFSSFEC